MKYITAFLTAALLFGCASPPEEKPMDQHQRLVEVTEDIRDELGIPALCVWIVSSTEVVDAVVTGVRDINRPAQVTADDRFHLGSVGKSLTGFLAAVLVERGLLSWDTKFFSLLPELKDTCREEYHAMSLEQLLSHRSRMQPYLKGTEIAEVPVDESKDIMNQRIQFCMYVLRQKPARSSPVSRFKPYVYSNAGIVAAAVMLERASGKSWEELIREVFCEDLNMDFLVGWPISAGADQPRGHLPGSYLGRGSRELVVYDKEYRYKNQEIMNPAGHIHVDMADFTRFIQLNLQGLGGISNVLSAETYHFLHFGLPYYSIGWENSAHRKKHVSEHEGNPGNFFCYVRNDVENDTSIVLFANSGIINALKPCQLFLGRIKLNRCLNRIKKAQTWQ
jgi:D-alanyl-D-alanine carboxypeptidase